MKGNNGTLTFFFCLVQYAFKSHAVLHGYDPFTTILKISPRPGEYALREEDIYDIIEKEGDSIALVLLGGVQFYTGQLFPMETITQKAHEKVSKSEKLFFFLLHRFTRVFKCVSNLTHTFFPFILFFPITGFSSLRNCITDLLVLFFKGCICGWDLAHAIGNVPLSLHNWKVDFAVWCSYKYLNSGPGGIAGLFVHELWHDSEKPK